MRLIGIIVLIIVFARTPTAHAQFVTGVRGAVVTNGGFSFNYSNKRASLTVFSGSSSFFRYGTNVWSPGCYGGVMGGPFFGPSVIVVSNPIVIVPQPILIPVRPDSDVPDPERFIVIRPNRIAVPAPVIPRPIVPVPVPAPANPGPPPVAPPPRVEKKKFPAEKIVKEVDLGIKPGAFPLAPGPAANPRVEADRQIERGKEAFAKGEYGWSLDHFRRATSLVPDESTSWFLLAQTQFAVGKYDDAAASIAAGLKLKPDWPHSRFQSRDVYGNNPGAFDVHLANLRAALAADPDDPRLLFLLGVELWFDGKRDEARPLLERAARLANDPTPALAFLKK